MNYASISETTDEKGHQYHIKTIPCPKNMGGCGKSVTLIVKGPDLFKYRQGAHMQQAFPYLAANERERLITGICGPCWHEMWNDGE